MKMNEMEMNLEELEMVSGGNILDDIADGLRKVKDAIEERLKNIPKVATGIFH